MKIKRKLLAIAVLAVLAFVCGAERGFTMESVNLSFHGYVQSQAVLRDTDGFQYGLLDDTSWVQLLNQLKFDIELVPQYTVEPCVKVSKLFLSYRGGYDAIYDLKNTWNDVPDSRRGGGSRYDLGLDDVRSENDLREVFVDVGTKLGEGTVNGRFGRQITQWGEADMFNLINVVNPSDLRGIGNFANPDELANPIWMSRFDYNSGAVGPFSNISGQFLVIPDNRPTVFAPADAYASAPMTSIFIPGVDVRQNDHATGFNNMQYGARLGLVAGYLQSYFYYFDGFQAGSALNFSDIGAGKVYLDHPRYEMWGFSFNYNLEDVLKQSALPTGVLRGEFSYTDKMSVMDFVEGDADAYSMHKVYQALLAFDKTLHPKWIGTDSAVPWSLQVFYKHIDGWSTESASANGLYHPDNWRLTTSAQTDYMHGSLTIGFAAAYDCTGVLLFVPYGDYTPDGRWYFHAAANTFWGKQDAQSELVNSINSTDVILKVGYRW